MLPAHLRVLRLGCAVSGYLEQVMCVITLTRIALAILFILAISSTAKAHCFVGDRFFPATLIVDDPCVND